MEARRLRPVLRLAPTAHELALLARHAQRLAAWGWELREAAGGGVLLEGVPAIEGVALGAPALHEYCHTLDEAADGGAARPPPAALRVLASKACRSAVMFGTALTTQRCQEILAALARCDNPWQCAHGRPTITPVLSLDALPTDEVLHARSDEVP